MFISVLCFIYKIYIQYTFILFSVDFSKLLTECHRKQTIFDLLYCNTFSLRLLFLLWILPWNFVSAFFYFYFYFLVIVVVVLIYFFLSCGAVSSNRQKKKYLFENCSPFLCVSSNFFFLWYVSWFWNTINGVFAMS